MHKYHILVISQIGTQMLWSHLFHLYLYPTHASYDPVQDSWKRLADMREFRSNFSVVVHEKHLYAIGGDKEINTNVDSVEMYNPDNNTWR